MTPDGAVKAWSRPPNLHPEFWPRWIFPVVLAGFCIVAGFIVTHASGRLQLDLDLSRETGWIYLVIFSIVALMVLHRPRLAVLVLTAVVCTNLSEIGVRRFDVPSVIQVMALFFAVVILNGIVSRKGSRPVLEPIFLCCALFLSAVSLSSLDVSSAPNSDKYLIQLLSDFFLVYIVLTYVTTASMLRRCVWVLVASGAALATLGLSQVLTGGYGFDFYGFATSEFAHIEGRVHKPRLSGPLSDPNFYAQVLAFLLPLSFYRAVGEKSKGLRLVASVAFLVVAAALVFTYSRAGAVVAAIVTTAMLIQVGLKVRYWLLISVIAVCAVLLSPQHLTGRFANLGQLIGAEPAMVFSTESALQQRKLYMTAAATMVREHPYLGVGAGNYQVEFPATPVYVDEYITSYKHPARARSAHSLYLEIAAETGLLGIFAFALIILAAAHSLWRAWRLSRENGDDVTAWLVVGISFAMGSYLMTSVFLHSSYLRYFWLLVALSVCARRAAEQAIGGGARTPMLGDTIR